jgi:hypothetical protein
MANRAPSGGKLRRPNPRMISVETSYEVDETIPIDEIIPVEVQTAINRLAHFEFSSEDFTEMADALAFCVATWKQRKNALKKGHVLDVTDNISKASLSLKHLLLPDSDPHPPSNKDRALAVRYIATRRRISLTDAEICSMLDEINGWAQSEARLLKGTMRELRQGSDGAHLDDLLWGILEVLTRNKLNTTYGTPDGDSDLRSGLASDIAGELSRLLPDEIRLPPPRARSIFLNRLVAMRHRENMRASSSGE